MAIRSRELPPASVVGASSTLHLSGGKMTESLLATIVNLISGLVQKINGRIDKGNGTSGSWTGNLDGQWIRLNVSAGTVEHEVPHGLGRVPIGFYYTAFDGEVAVYASHYGSWGYNVLFVTTVAAGSATILIEVF